LRQAGIVAAQNGHKTQARRYLRQSIALDGNVEETWLWLAGVAVTPQESEYCLRQALALNPGSRRAQAGLRWLRQRAAAMDETARRAAPAAPQSPARTATAAPLTSSAPPVYRLRYWVGAVLMVWLVVLLAGGLLLTTLGAGSPIDLVRPTPTATAVPGTPTPTNLQRVEMLHDPLWTAWEAQDWPECLRVLQEMQALYRDYGGLDDWFIAVHLAWGAELVAERQLPEAVTHFDAVRLLDRNEQTAQTQRLLALAYLAAEESLAAEEWQLAIRQLRAVLGLNPDYLDAAELLRRAYDRLGQQQQASGEWLAAQDSYQQALAIAPDAEVQAALAEVVFLLTPPTPTPMPKRIEVSISQQRMYVYEGDRLIWNWVVSTGEPGRDTRTGHFSVLDKIPNAYASRWDLQMPYWLGIYYAGASENGIHALPILSSGQRLWEGYLGHRVSYGCVILGTEEARLLYDWASVGTPVDIYP